MKRKKTIIFLIFLILFSLILIYLSSISPKKIVFFKNGWFSLWGGSSSDNLTDIQIDYKNKVIITCGYTFSRDKDLQRIAKGNQDAVLLGYDFNGNKLWEKCIGGGNIDNFNKIILTPLNEVFAIGSSSSKDGDLKNLAKGNDDGIVFKFNTKGQFIWKKCVGGSNFDCIQDITYYKDQIACVGYFFSSDGDFLDKNKGVADAFIVSINRNNGKINWIQTFGGSGFDEYTKIISTNDGYIVIGKSGSDDKDMKGNSKGKWDAIIAKYSINGYLKWVRILGGSGNDYINDAIVTKKNEIVVIGTSLSKDGFAEETNGKNLDAFVACFSSNGNLKWKSFLYGSGDDILLKIRETSDGKLIVGGITNSYDGHFRNISSGNKDIVIGCLTSTGKLQWLKSIGGSNDDELVSLEVIDDNIFIGCVTSSNDKDVYKKNKGKKDILIVTININSRISSLNVFGGEDNDILCSFKIINQNQFCGVGYSTSKKGLFKNLYKGNEDGLILNEIVLKL